MRAFQNTVRLLLKICILALAYLSFTHGSFAAPTDTGKNTTVTILFARTFTGKQTDSGMIQKLIDSVGLQQGTTVMNCDSAYLNLQTNNLEAFGNVRITQPGGTAGHK